MVTKYYKLNDTQLLHQLSLFHSPFNIYLVIFNPISPFSA